MSIVTSETCMLLLGKPVSYGVPGCKELCTSSQLHVKVKHIRYLGFRQHSFDMSESVCA